MFKFTLRCSIKTLKSDNTKFETKFQVENVSKEEMVNDSKGRPYSTTNSYVSHDRIFEELKKILKPYFGEPDNPNPKSYHCIYFTFEKNDIEDFKQNFRHLEGNTNISIERKINGKPLDAVNDEYMGQLEDKY